MSTIPFLKPGDTIGISATARKISKSEIINAVDFLTSQGFIIKLASNLFSEYHQFAGNDEQRIIGFQELLDNDNVKAIINARGGYGTARIIDKIDFGHFINSPKWLCGFSDFTVVLTHLYTLFDLPSIHGPMIINFAMAKETQVVGKGITDVLMGNPIRFSFPNHELNRAKSLDGVLMGGNLSVLYSLLGSSSFRQKKDIILFIEDLDEYLYHIDRMMNSFKRAGVLSHIKGLIVGSMSDMHDNLVPFGMNAYEIIRENVEMYKFPVFFDFPLGHIEQQKTVINGQICHLVVNNDMIQFNQLPGEDIY